MIGQGKYDDICTEIRTRLEADGVILIVANGKEGSGMSCQLVPEVAVQTPGVLRLAADILEKDVKKFQSGALN